MKFLLFVLVLFSSVANAGEFDHLRNGKYWGAPPSVFICSGTSIDKNIVSQAVNFWISQGFKIQKDVKVKDCSREIQIGQITIEYFGSGENPEYYNAVAHSYNFENNSMKKAYAKLYVRKSLKDEVDIYKHEIGHAIGLSDEYSDYQSFMTHEKVY